MCWRSSTAIRFCNGIEHVGPCWMLKTWQPPPSPSTVLCDQFWFFHNLSPWSSSSCLFWAFSRGFFFHVDWWCKVSTSFGFVITSYYWGFGMVLEGLNLGLQFGMGINKIKVYILTEDQVVYTHKASSFFKFF